VVMTTPPVLSKVHTFAQDLERVRGSRGDMPATTRHQATTTPPAVASNDKSADTTPLTTTPSLPNAPVKLTAASGRDASYPATIITDKKRHTFNLTEEVTVAIGDWWNDKVKTLKGGKKPTYSVPAVERRKGIVQTATTQTGRGATSDHREIVAKLKQETHHTTSLRDSVVLPTQPIIAAPSLITPTDTAPKIGYDADVDEAEIVREFAAEPEGVVERVAASVDSAPSPTDNSRTNNITVTEVVTRTPRIEPTIPTQVSTPLEDAFGGDDEPEVLEPTPIVSAPVPTPIEPLSFPKINPVVPTTPITPPSTQRENAFSLLAEVPKPTLPTTSTTVKDTIAMRMEQRVPTDTGTSNRFGAVWHYAPYLVGGLFLILTAGGIGYFMLTSTTPSTDTSTATDLPMTGGVDTTEPASYTPAAVTAQLDAPNKTSLYNAIKNTTGLGDGLYIVTPLAHDTATPLGVREILALINRQLSPDFVGNVTNLQVGMYRESPVLLLTISDENSARGGMFRWEDTLSQDLSPWFGQALRTTSTESLTGFTDGDSAGRDVRILTDDIGTERITYGFINQSVLLITTDTTAFLNIADSYTTY
jgi:hypothetical protein